jgi:hypothetical protein
VEIGPHLTMLNIRTGLSTPLKWRMINSWPLY